MGKIISNGIEYGGLIKVEGALIKEIWVNNNVQPIGVFSINLDLSDYDFVGFRFEQNTSDMGKITPIQIVKNELGATVFVFNASGGSSAVIGRSATITSTGITFSDGYVPNVGYYNNLLVPVTIYGIQQGSGANNGGIDYSTTEQKTGQKWIDGSAIYQRTYVLQTEVLAKNNAWYPSEIDGSEMNRIIDVKSLDSNDSFYSGFFGAIINGYVNFQSWSSVGVVMKTVTIQYTKSTT